MFFPNFRRSYILWKYNLFTETSQINTITPDFFNTMNPQTHILHVSTCSSVKHLKFSKLRVELLIVHYTLSVPSRLPPLVTAAPSFYVFQAKTFGVILTLLFVSQHIGSATNYYWFFFLSVSKILLLLFRFITSVLSCA